MELWAELFSSWFGILSFLVILFMLGMGVFFIRMFIANSSKEDN